jgi:hypothetical protein
MERDAPDPPDPTPPDPPQDRPGKTVPGRIAFVLHAVGILLGYGRHLLATVRHRAAAPTFTTIAASFGTANLSTILAHLNRGILRATALERVLLARAATGRDINFVERRRARADETPPAPAGPQAEPPAEQPATRKRKPRPSPGSDDPELYMPTSEELERQVRRRTIGRTIAEICLDLAVVPVLCSSAFWNDLFNLMHYYGGGGVVTLMREKQRRGQAFIQEQDKNIDSNWDWSDPKPDALRQILGFFIGEEPVDPFAPAAAPATGPP